MKQKNIIVLVFTLTWFSSYSQLIVDAGKDTTFCTGQNINTMILGTTAKIMNGRPPFKFAWECTYRLTDKLIFTASDFLNDTTLQSPTFKDITVDQDWLKFTLTVTDSENNYTKDSIFIRFSKFDYLTGGGQTRFYIEKGDSILLNFNDVGIGGGISPLKHQWQPKAYLSNPDSVITWCKPDSSIQYEVVAIDSCGCVSYPEMAYDIRILPKNTSHDYQTVFSNRIALFENSENQINALRIDSVKVDTDSVFYPFATIQEISKNCFSPNKASWIGEKVIVKPDGINLFFNRDGDTITLKTNARINETWIAFQRGNDFRVKATVQSIELENFLGLTDSVKTISLTVTDQNENSLEHPLNNLSLRISKTYGFIETFNFYLFPDMEVHDTQEKLENLSLAGLTNPNVGVQNLTWFEVNDFQPGDELHILDESSSWIEHAGDRIGYAITNKANYKYLERIDYTDSIVYIIARKQSIETVYPDSTTFELYNETIKSVFSANPDFDKLPGEPIFYDIDSRVYNFQMTNESLISKTDPKTYGNFYSADSICWGMIMFDGCARNNTYFKGLGGPYYKCTNCCSLGGEERKIVYYKKGETEWGEKLVITDVPDSNDNNPEFAPIGAKWYYNHPNSTSNDYVVFESKKDSTIQGKDSRVVDVWLNNSRLVGREYIHQNGDSIFYYNDNYDSFFLLYDFSAKAGDTITIHAAKFKPTKAFFSYDDSIANFKYKILLVDSVQLSGQWIKRQKVTLLQDGLWGFSKPDGKDYYIINKIGSLAYFFGIQSGITPEDNPSICRCYRDSNFEFKNPLWVSECDYIYPERMNEFAPIGAEWYYNYEPDVTLDEGYQKITVLRDTIIDNQSCRLLQVRNIGYSYFYKDYYDYKTGNIILYEKDNIVYYYKNKQFYVLYDFAAKAGDSYNSIGYLSNCSQTFKVSIDSVTYVEVDEQLLKNFHVTLNDSFQTNYIEKIGYDEYLLPQFGFGCEILTGPHYPGPLRCYSDDSIGIYSTNIVSNCDYITSSTENKIFNDLKFFPNPTESYVTISNPSNIKITKIELIDISGRIVQMWNATECAGKRLCIQHISPGVYLLKAETDAGIKSEKLVVQ